MNKLYVLWIRLKYQFYKRIYWKIKRPRRTSGFYGWQEVHYSVLDPDAIGYGIIMEDQNE